MKNKIKYIKKIIKNFLKTEKDKYIQYLNENIILFLMILLFSKNTKKKIITIIILFFIMIIVIIYNIIKKIKQIIEQIINNDDNYIQEIVNILKVIIKNQFIYVDFKIGLIQSFFENKYYFELYQKLKKININILIHIFYFLYTYSFSCFKIIVSKFYLLLKLERVYDFNKKLPKTISLFQFIMIFVTTDELYLIRSLTKLVKYSLYNILIILFIDFGSQIKMKQWVIVDMLKLIQEENKNQKYYQPAWFLVNIICFFLYIILYVIFFYYIGATLLYNILTFIIIQILLYCNFVPMNYLLMVTFMTIIKKLCTVVLINIILLYVITKFDEYKNKRNHNIGIQYLYYIVVILIILFIY